MMQEQRLLPRVQVVTADTCRFQLHCGMLVQVLQWCVQSHLHTATERSILGSPVTCNNYDMLKMHSL